MFKKNNATCVVDPMLGGVLFGSGATVEAYATFRRYAVIGTQAFIGEAASIGPGSVIGYKARIGHHACLGADVFVRSYRNIPPFACVSMGRNYKLIITMPKKGDRCYWDKQKNKCVSKPW